MANREVNNRRFAAFDIDGTIFRWQLYHELFDAFIEEGILSHAKAYPVIAARDAWRERTADYLDYERELINAMQEVIVGVEESHFNRTCDKILKSKGNHVYRYTIDLLRQLKKDGYTIIAISGSHQQLVDRFAKIHDIDISIGRNHTIRNGKLTEVATQIFGRKDVILKDIVQENKLTWKDSYAVGDSSGDIPMLSLVENPVAFNPDSGLKDVAIANGWPIVVERKSIAYRLEKGPDGSYILA